MKLKNKKVLVYGLGISGKETIKFLLSRGAKVFYYDDNLKTHIKGCIPFNVNFDFSSINFAIISPGIYNTYLLKLLNIANVEIFSELEFAFRQIRHGKVIAITGTNGKTTTCAFLSEVFTTAGKKVFMCGNIGVPLISYVNEDCKNSYYIVEVSSFQLEQCSKFKPNISMILNITLDHLNRHKTFENYKNLKFSITKNQTKKEYVILNEDLLGYDDVNNIKAKIYTFGKMGDCEVKDDAIYCKGEKIINTADIALGGEKNWENVMACVLGCKICGIENKHLIAVAKTFRAMKHRFEVVATKRGVVYINDSKATNPSSTCCALSTLTKNVLLLLGGSDKGYDFDEIFDYKDVIKHIFCFGQTKEKIKKSANKFKFENITVCERLFDAFVLAKKMSRSGDTVLLSPACASFDEFKNYEHRGNYFKGLVNGEK